MIPNRERAHACAMRWMPDSAPDSMRLIALACHIELCLDAAVADKNDELKAIRNNDWIRRTTAAEKKLERYQTVYEIVCEMFGHWSWTVVDRAGLTARFEVLMPTRRLQQLQNAAVDGVARSKQQTEWANSVDRTLSISSAERALNAMVRALTHTLVPLKALQSVYGHAFSQETKRQIEEADRLASVAMGVAGRGQVSDGGA